MNRTAVLDSPTESEWKWLNLLTTDRLLGIEGLFSVNNPDIQIHQSDYGTGTSSFDQWTNYIRTALAYKDLTRSARENLRSVPNRELAKTAMMVLHLIDEQVRRKPSISHLPEIYSILLDDGSILIEWAFPNLRLGFGIAPNPEESSWFLVTSETAGNISAFGKLFSEKVSLPIEWLVNFITMNPKITV